MEVGGPSRRFARQPLKLVARHEGREIAIEIERAGAGYRVISDGRVILADLVSAGGHIHSLRLEDGRQFSLIDHRTGNLHEITLLASSIHVEITDPMSLKRSRSEDQVSAGGLIRALMPGRIVRVLVSKGDEVKKGAGLLVLEAMKMENEITAATDGVVAELFVTTGDTVDSGAELMLIETA